MTGAGQVGRHRLASGVSRRCQRRLARPEPTATRTWPGTLAAGSAAGPVTVGMVAAGLPRPTRRMPACPKLPAARPAQEGWLGHEAVLVPVKAFGEAKLRLAPALSAPERAALARTMATRVVASAAGLPVAVVCDDLEVAAWARELGALVIWEPGRGLNGAVQEGVSRWARPGSPGRRGGRRLAPRDGPAVGDPLRRGDHRAGPTPGRHQRDRGPAGCGIHLLLRARIFRPPSRRSRRSRATDPGRALVAPGVGRRRAGRSGCRSRR